MRVLFDTNVFISYLLHKDKNNIFATIIEAGFKKKFALLLPEELLNELKVKIIEKKYLIKFISKSEAKDFIDLISEISEIIPQITENLPVVVRDKKDDYLIAYGTVGNADYLVSGDKDLLVLKKIGNLIIVSPALFHKILTKGKII